MATRKIETLKAHLALNVRNVERSIEFYRKMLGLEPAKVRTGYAKFDVQDPPLNLTLNEQPFNERGALSHLGIQVASTADVLAMRARWVEAGLLTRDEMQTDCCYATQDKTWVRDPDGNEWEVFVVLVDGLPETATLTSHSQGPAPVEVDATRGGPVTQETTAQPANVCCAPQPVGIER